MDAHQTRSASAQAACGKYELALLDRYDLSPNQATDREPMGQKQDGEDAQESTAGSVEPRDTSDAGFIGHRHREHAAQEGHDQHRDEQAGQRIQRIHNAHDDVVQPSAKESTDQPQRDADQQDDHLGADGDRQRHARAPHQPRQLVASKRIGAQPVRRRGQAVGLQQRPLSVVKRRDPRRGDGHHHQ